MESARTLLTLGDKEYGNAIGICIIHAVISANDAITIHLGEVRSSSEQHADAQRLLLEVTKKVPEKVLRAYGSVVQAKFEYEYSGDVFTPAAARRLLVKAEVFYRGTGTTALTQARLRSSHIGPAQSRGCCSWATSYRAVVCRRASSCQGGDGGEPAGNVALSH